jgi:hypothetical protein
MVDVVDKNGASLQQIKRGKCAVGREIVSRQISPKRSKISFDNSNQQPGSGLVCSDRMPKGPSRHSKHKGRLRVR